MKPQQSEQSLNDETIRAVKAELRAAMNGVAAARMRESGMNYRLIFGVELPRLRDIASEFTPESRLAQALWNEPIRECKILAVLLYPLESFFFEVAEIWVEELKDEQSEIAQILSMELLSKAPYASELAFRWMADERERFQLCGYLTLARLLMCGAELSPDAEQEFLDQALSAQTSVSLPLRKAVANALTFYQASKENE